MIFQILNTGVAVMVIATLLSLSFLLPEREGFFTSDAAKTKKVSQYFFYCLVLNSDSKFRFSTSTNLRGFNAGSVELDGSSIILNSSDARKTIGISDFFCIGNNGFQFSRKEERRSVVASFHRVIGICSAGI